MAEHLEREAGALLPLVTETAKTAADLCRGDGVEVRRILDIGSGPGVIACELARLVPSAIVVAADGAEPLLEIVRARAAAAGLSNRVTTRQVDLPDEIESLGRADLIWMAMVLHHIGDEAALLRRVRSMLNPGGVLVLVEHGEPMRFLPDDAAPGSPGLFERLAMLNAEWLADMRAGLPGSVPSADHRSMLEAAGFEPAVDRVAHVEIGPPLTAEGRGMVLDHLRWMRELFGERYEKEDRDALDILIDDDHPLGIMRRPDVFLDTSRHIYVARAT